MKFSQIAKGKRAERPTKFRYGGEDVATLLVPLSAGDEMAVDEAAIKIAKVRGAEVSDASPVYRRALMMATLHLGCVDPDSPPDARTPTFDVGIDQLLELDPDTLAHLYEEHQLHQELVAPNYRQATVPELVRMCKEVAASEQDPFRWFRYSRGMQSSCARFMASLLQSLHALNTSSGASATSAETVSSKRNSSAPGDAAKPSADSANSPETR